MTSFIMHGAVLLYAVLTASALCPTTQPIDCEDIDSNRSSIYYIYPEKTSGMEVYCDMETEGGGWTVIQRRESPSDFYQDWDAYETGFGDLSSNFWLGNVQISAITSQNWYQLRVDMVHENGTKAFAGYKKFAVGDRASNYQLTVSGYNGTAGDGFKLRHNGYGFTTRDKDYDIYRGNCAGLYRGGWWYDKCHTSNLNGVFGSRSYGQGINWRPFTSYYSSLAFVEMKIKRWVPRPNRGETSVSAPH